MIKSPAVSLNFISLTGFTLLLSISSQSFSSVIYTDDSRYVSRSGGDGYEYSWSRVDSPSAPFADFVTYRQTSSLSANGFMASGSGETSSNVDWSASWSYFDVSFNLSTRTQVDLTGLLTGTNIYNGSGDASISLFDGVGNVLYSNSVSAEYGYRESAIQYNAILGEGDYRILTVADPFFQDANSSYSLQANLTPSPIPVHAALWLFGSGLIGLVGLARRKKV